MAESRLIGGYPVIGIRPTIDGRRGPLKVRESLEEQTMGMAQAAKKLFEENLKYSNGEPVKVVIADSTIGRVAEAAACEEKFRKEQYSDGYFNYKEDGFGPTCYTLEDTKKEILNFINDQNCFNKYNERINKFFKYTDCNNCERIYEEITEVCFCRW